MSETYNINVPANVPWFDTGISIGLGDYLDFHASGQVQPWPNAVAIGPQGRLPYWDQSLVPTELFCSLVGRITQLPPPPGYNFGIGVSKTEIAKQAGHLYLSVNDGSNFGDNSGQYTVSLKIQRAYNRHKASQWAALQATSNFDTFPFGSGDLTASRAGKVNDGTFIYTPDLVTHKGGKTGSALFISESLYTGSMPMTAPNQQPTPTCSANDTGTWRVCCDAANKANATGTWRNHVDLKNYFSTRPGGLIVNNGVDYNTLKSHINFDAGGVITNQSNLEGSLYPLFNASGALASVDTGDYIFIDLGQCNTLSKKHGFLIVGWGPIVDCTMGLNAVEQSIGGSARTIYSLTKSQNTIPYVVDFSYGFEGAGTGWLQDPRPRPFYASAAAMSSQIINTIPTARTGYSASDYISRSGGNGYRYFTYGCNSVRPQWWTFVHLPPTTLTVDVALYVPGATC